VGDVIYNSVVFATSTLTHNFLGPLIVVSKNWILYIHKHPEMKAICTFEMLATSPTSTRCKKPRADLISAEILKCNNLRMK
jgi:hypothetical protein